MTTFGSPESDVICIQSDLTSPGLAVGVGFGAVGQSSSSTFENARNLAVGIGIQNFPEGQWKTKLVSSLVNLKAPF